ncbi:hypothetical protein [Silanimonas lenta]|uniref:hypothetical protein n=1 Tax=Silanimonas lenta TaxID=265429 RepID=UPI002FE0B6F8
MSESRRFRPPWSGGLVLGLLLPALAAAAVPDPFRPAAPLQAGPGPSPEPAAPALVLQSTLVSPQQRSAIINGRRYRQGDRVGEARLEAIGPGWVRLRGPEGATELRLSYSTLTRPVNR